VYGRQNGQWHEADPAVAHWLQHTSRDGDMQLPVHSQIAQVARTVTDGKWRARWTRKITARSAQTLNTCTPLRPGLLQLYLDLIGCFRLPVSLWLGLDLLLHPRGVSQVGRVGLEPTTGGL
jgi:hypothetical protein